ncbi:Bug family tripartite tricarboxylate transporter substrate binding protein [Ottowia thiooxydans]|uniref:Bug family tripartite tricarboxylate transporter substrate binding protein n=1 Tax=Ottowia thiooxydans TaxID=219182 RepID=UPI00040FF268|nr:tripartite tricarboxylate transporter substrate binding protein [Ottowia thiooxydans]
MKTSYPQALSRRTLALCMGAALLGSSAAALAASPDGYPNKPIRWVVGFPAGGGTDVLARTVGVQLTEQIKQSVLIDNRPGAAGMLAAETVAHAAADGYTVLTGDIAIMTFNGALYQKIRYDALKDFTPVGLMARFPVVVATHPASGIQSMQQLVAGTKKPDGKLTYGSAGVGTPHHLTMELVGATTGGTITHVPYKGDAPALQDLVGGQLPVAVLSPSLSLPYFRSGKLRPLAVSSDTRLPQLPDVPTLKELGFASTGVYAWQGLVAPKGTPPAAIEALSQQVQQALSVPAVRQKLADLGMEPIPSDAAQMDRHVRAEKAIWEPLIKSRGIRAD